MNVMVSDDPGGARAAALRRAASMPGPRTERLIEVAAVIAEAVKPNPLVVVGGLAVAAWTVVEATDIDVLMPDTIEVVGRLEGLGLEKPEGDRHWYLPGTELAIEAPGVRLAEYEVSLPYSARSGLEVEVLSPADLVAWRLNEFVATGHPEPAEQMVALRLSSRYERAQLERHAGKIGLSPVLDLLDQVADNWEEGYEPADLQEIARQMTALLR